MTWEEHCNDIKEHIKDDDYDEVYCANNAFVLDKQDALKAFADELVKRMNVDIRIERPAHEIVKAHIQRLLHEAGVEK